MIKIGMMIGDRYEILEKIGTGGMSDVYKAKCHKLNRLVAVKVLKQEFSENANFVSKFRVEAQAAAGLMHPNVVNVYDVGDENGIYYIVMELVEGITIKKYIEKKARLSVKEAVTIAIQISQGIEAAHNNHIIHRDIKPQNVILSKDGKVKVTDFGIAKAATSNTITSNVMGSVHYTSPEQARGGFSDEKSDIYSLGITLFEMVTGRVPFNGDTTVAIAIKQIQEEMPSPREFVPEIPISVEQIILKCTQKSPDRRYQSMAELIADLRHSYTNPDDDFVRIEADDEYGATVLLTGAEMSDLKKSVRETEPITVPDMPKVSDDKQREDEFDPKLDRITTILVIVVAVIICIVAILLIGKAIGLFKLGQSRPSATTAIEKVEKVEMPDVTLMSYERAKEILEKNKLTSKVKYEESNEYEAGIVIKASVQDGLKVDVGSEIELTVSAGSSTEVVPTVTGENLNTANRALIDLGFTVVKTEEHSANVPKGYIISQEPEGGSKAPVNSEVTIVVSQGPNTSTVSMPKLIGSSEEDALTAIEDAGLTVGERKYVFSEEYNNGVVCAQSTNAGDNVIEGTSIDIEISKGSIKDAEGSYGFHGNILAPTTNEDSDYTSGTEVRIVITTMSGEEIYNTTTTSFPCAVNLSNIPGTDETGILTMTYTISLPPTSFVDSLTGETVLVPGDSEVRKIEREITFTKEVVE